MTKMGYKGERERRVDIDRRGVTNCLMAGKVCERAYRLTGLGNLL